MTDLIPFTCICITVHIVCKIAKLRAYTPDGINQSYGGGKSSGMGSSGGD